MTMAEHPALSSVLQTGSRTLSARLIRSCSLAMAAAHWFDRRALMVLPVELCSASTPRTSTWCRSAKAKNRASSSSSQSDRIRHSSLRAGVLEPVTSLSRSRASRSRYRARFDPAVCTSSSIVIGVISRSISRQPVGSCRALVARSRFDGGAFFIVIPRSDHQKRHRLELTVVAKELQSVVERLAATSIDVAIHAPGGFAVVETWPRSAHGDLVGLALHLLIEGLEIRLAPVASISRPFLGGMHPGVAAVEGIRVLGRRVVLVKQERRNGPTIELCSHPVPIGVAAFGKDKNYRAAVLLQVGVPAGGAGPKVSAVGFGHCRQ